MIHHIEKNLRIHLGDFPDIADILPTGKALLYLEHCRILAGDSDRLDAELLHHGHKVFGDTAQHHLRNFHRFLVSHAKSVDKLCLFSGLSDPG